MGVSYRELDIYSVDYDITNPRVAHLFETVDNPTPDEMARALRDESSESLRRSIKRCGKIENPIKVVEVSPGRYRVFEGNTRLSIYRKFHESGEPGTWESIPVVIHRDIDEATMDQIRIQDHLVGPQPWSAYAKAKYLHDLVYVKGMMPNEIADLCGISQKSIMDSIGTFVFMNKDYREIVENEEIDGPNPDPIFNQKQYTAFETFVSRTAIQDAVYEAGYTDRDFSQWIAGGLFTRNEHVRDIGQILEKPEAKKAFLKYGTQEAKKLLDTPELTKQLREATLVALCAAICEKIPTVPNAEIQSIIGEPSNLMRLRDAQIELGSFVNTYKPEEAD